MPYNMIFYFRLPYFSVSTSAAFLHSSSVLSFYINVVLSLSIDSSTGLPPDRREAITLTNYDENNWHNITPWNSVHKPILALVLYGKSSIYINICINIFCIPLPILLFMDWMSCMFPTNRRNGCDLYSFSNSLCRYVYLDGRLRDQSVSNDPQNIYFILVWYIHIK